MRILSFISAFILTAVAVPASANNNIPPSTILTGTSGSLVGSNASSNSQTNENATYGAGNINSMWYSWTATASGVFTASTCNPTGNTTTNFDTTLIAYAGPGTTFPMPTVLSSSDDATGCASTAGGGLASVISFNVVQGSTYHLQVDGYASNTGNYNLFWGLAAITVTPVITTATEGGATGSFTVRLSSPPAATPPGGNGIAAQSATVTVNAGSQCTYAVSPLTFTSANWQTPQTVTVTAINDVNVEGAHNCSPTSIVAAGGAYAGVAVATANLPTTAITDNDVASLAFNKSWSFAPGGDLNGNGQVDKNDVIRYSFATTNNGTVPMSNVFVTEIAFSGSGTAPIPSNETLTDVAPLGNSSDATANNGTWSVLAAGDTVTMTANYVVTQTDIDNQ